MSAYNILGFLSEKSCGKIREIKIETQKRTAIFRKEPIKDAFFSFLYPAAQNGDHDIFSVLPDISLCIYFISFTSRCSAVSYVFMHGVWYNISFV